MSAKRPTKEESNCCSGYINGYTNEFVTVIQRNRFSERQEDVISQRERLPLQETIVN